MENFIFCAVWSFFQLIFPMVIEFTPYKKEDCCRKPEGTLKLIIKSNTVVNCFFLDEPTLAVNVNSHWGVFRTMSNI